MEPALEVLSVGSVKITTIFKPIGHMLEQENQLKEALNQSGILGTGFILEQFDADGDPIIFSESKYCTCGKFNQIYETPYGKVHVNRHAYQTAKGGPRLIPPEINAGTLLNSTPLFAQILTANYSTMCAATLKKTLEITTKRSISLDYVRQLSDKAASIALNKEDNQ
jgi:hypothetical protein